MTRLEEIEARMAAITEECEQENADIDALTEEVRRLKEERESIVNAAEKRNRLKTDIASGKAGNVIKTFQEDKKMEERTFAVDTEEYRSAFLRKLQGKELNAEERAAVTANAAIPTETMNMIVSRLELNPLIAAVDVTHIPGNVSYPVESSAADASWVAMGTASTDSTDALTAVSLGAYKLIKTVEITADVSAMSVPAFEAWLVDRLANKLEKAVDNAIINGTGTNQPTGLLKSGEITNTGTFTKAAMKYKDLCGIIAAVPSQYLNGSSMLTTRALFYGEILGMEDTAGNRVVVADAQSPAKFNVLGFPVIVDDNTAEDTIVFGDFKAYKFNFAADPTVESDASVGFRSGSVVYRAMALADGKLADKTALCKYTRATA